MTEILKRKLKGTGLILLSIILFFVSVLVPYRRQMTSDEWIGLAISIVLALAGLSFLLRKDEVEEPGTKADEETDQAVKQFREHLADFYEQPGNPENTPLQQSVTQFLWHRLMLQKRRLNDKGLYLQIQTERRTHKRILPLRQDHYFDGKYQITEVKETIEGAQLFWKRDNTKGAYRHRLPNAATYRFLHAERTDGDKIICPNCGAASTRENLLDGCDHCGTKFTIEDLGTRISDYAYIPDHAAEKESFDSVLRKYQRILLFVVGIPAFLYWITSMYQGLLYRKLTYVEYGFVWENLLNDAGWIIAAVLFCLFLSAVFVVPALFVFHLIIAPVFLVGRLSQHTAYPTAKSLKELGENTRNNLAVAERIRKTDPLFSLEGFLANVENQLALVHYSNRRQDAAAFAESERTETELASKLPEYADVIDMTIHEITLSDYETDELFQKIFLKAECRLLAYREDEFHEKTERIHLRMIKKASCRTQSICAPKFMICEGCGASISLLAGRKCQSCGREYRLSDVDWVIGHYDS